MVLPSPVPSSRKMSMRHLLYPLSLANRIIVLPCRPYLWSASTVAQVTLPGYAAGAVEPLYCTSSPLLRLPSFRAVPAGVRDRIGGNSRGIANADTGVRRLFGIRVHHDELEPGFYGRSRLGRRDAGRDQHKQDENDCGGGEVHGLQLIRLTASGNSRRT